MARVQERSIQSVMRFYGDPALRGGARDVVSFDDELRQLAERLLAIQAREEAVGLAAVQIGVPVNMFVIDEGQIRRKGKSEVFVNAILISAESERTDEEGCLSFPGIFIKVKRPSRVVIRAWDLEGNRFEREAEGMLARAYHHEFEHLQGRLMIDRADPSTRYKVLKKLGVKV